MRENVRFSKLFYCFSPLVMAITVILELLLMAYLLATRKMNQSLGLILFIIFFLAMFQMAEYGICEQLGLDSTAWARLGFGAITLLPILGLHLVYSITNRHNPLLLSFGYLLSIAWIGYFIFGGILHQAVCGGNYVIFDVSEPQEGLYYVFYNSFLFIALVQAIRFMSDSSSQIKNALKWLVIGYLSFIVPSIIVRLLSEQTGPGLPSILCGFAVMLAIILTVKVAPLISEEK